MRTSLLTIFRVLAVVATGLIAGVFVGHYAGVQHASRELDAASFVQLQQVIHVHFVRFMPLLTLAALLASIAWLVLASPRWRGAEFWCVAASVGALVVIAAVTRFISVPINQQLMAWSTTAPPENLREIWAPWDRANTLRSVLAPAALILETIALALRAADR